MGVVLLSMLALVLAQIEPDPSAYPDEPAPILLPPMTPSAYPDEPAPILLPPMTPSYGPDSDTKCSAECFLAKKFPKHHAACLDHCKIKLQYCKVYPADLSYSIFKCTVTCVDSTSTKLAVAADKVNDEDQVEACYNSCKKNV